MASRRVLVLEKAAVGGRWLFLIVLAGHLLFRREFAHINLAQILAHVGIHAPFLGRVFVTEAALFLILPVAASLVWQRMTDTEIAPPGSADLRYGIGPAFFLAMAFLLWGGGHAIAGYMGAHESAYLILRQSVLAGYAVIFIYAYILFGDRVAFVRQAVLLGILISVLCALLDSAGLMQDPAGIGAADYATEPMYGQQTLPLAILGLGLCIVYMDHLFLRALMAAALGFVLWREGARDLQSVVPVSLAGAVGLYVLTGACAAFRGQTATLKRAVLLAALFGVPLLGGGLWKKATAAQSAEIGAWSRRTYVELLDIYDRTSAPPDPSMRVQSARQPGTMIDDPEVYKLNAVYARARPISISVVNNIWRLLMWRRMAHEWRTQHTWVGAGVGTGWAYNKILFHTPFYYESDPGGLNPHNSYLNMLYRYGVIGLLLCTLLIGSVLLSAGQVLRVKTGYGDVLLEGLMLYFFYTLIFAFFTVTLEGPSYSFPYWSALGVLYARGRQIRYSQAIAGR